MLQTADYARRVIPLADITHTVDHQAALAGRIQRQGILHGTGADQRLQFLITQRLLRWEPGPGTLLPQLAHLASTAALDRVELAILPDHFAGALPWHNFTLRYPADGTSPYAAAELIDGEHLVRDPDSVAIYEQLWRQLWDASLVGPEALSLIKEAST
jgi:Domain of unknown function (DUF5753)